MAFFGGLYIEEDYLGWIDFISVEPDTKKQKKREININMIKSRLDWILKTFRNNKSCYGDCN